MVLGAELISELQEGGSLQIFFFQGRRGMGNLKELG